MSIQSVSNKIDGFWLSKGINPQKTQNGYYMYVSSNSKLYIYPENMGATFMVIPTGRKYNIKRSMTIETPIGVLNINADPNLSNPSLIYGLSENALNNQSIDKVIAYMLNNVENIFCKCEKLQ